MVLHEKKLKSILDKVPEGMKVGIVSVVGAFRMGKSFLLDLMLHYLHYMADDSNAEWYAADESSNKERSYLEGSSSLRSSSGFSWRSGAERQTTGIWMWSEIFIRKNPKSSNEKVAILLMDTQGMFDGEISQQLTTHIFGVSTLLSSYQIYNVSRQIQEDNMQHLALFAEYGKLAVGHTKESTASSSSSSKDSKEEEGEEEDIPEAPFQRLDFLIRDWQNFDDDANIKTCLESMPTYLKSKLNEKHGMAESLRGTRAQIASSFRKLDCFLLPHPGFKVTKPNFDGNLKQVREEFLSLLRVYMDRIFNNDGAVPKRINDRELTAPEMFKFAVQYVNLFTKPARWQREIEPETDKWDDLPLQISDAIHAACTQGKTEVVFGNLRVEILGRSRGARTNEKTGESERLRLVHVFPEAQTLLEATAYVCNLNAKEQGYKSYKAFMANKCAANMPYVGVQDLEILHQKAEHNALQVFSGIATVGSSLNIQKHKLALLADIKALYVEIQGANANKDPYKNIEFYLIPGSVAFVAYAARVVTDVTCFEPQTAEFDFEWADVCTRASNYFWHLYMAVFFFCGIMFFAKGHAAARYLKMIFGVLQTQLPDTSSASLSSTGSSSGSSSSSCSENIKSLDSKKRKSD